MFASLNTTSVYITGFVACPEMLLGGDDEDGGICTYFYLLVFTLVIVIVAQLVTLLALFHAQHGLMVEVTSTTSIHGSNYDSGISSNIAGFILSNASWRR
jgi:hypothetical protein